MGSLTGGGRLGWDCFAYLSQPLLQSICLILLAFAISILVFYLNFGEENPTVANLNSVSKPRKEGRRAGQLHRSSNIAGETVSTDLRARSMVRRDGALDLKKDQSVQLRCPTCPPPPRPPSPPGESIAGRHAAPSMAREGGARGKGAQAS